MRRIVRRTLVQCGGVADRFARALHYLAAGTLRIDEFKEHTKICWRTYMAHEHQIASGLMTQERGLVQRFVSPLHRVLVIGCGRGRDLLPLADLGCSVYGVEPVPEAVATARRMVSERHLQAEIVEGFIEDVELPGLFDSVMISAYSYIVERRRRIDVLRKLTQHLQPGGRIIVGYDAARARPTAMIGFARAMAMLCASDWHPERGDTVIPMGSGIFRFTHFFTAEEIQSEAVAGALRVLAHDDQPAPGEEERAFVVLSREN